MALWQPIVSFFTNKSTEDQSVVSHGKGDQVKDAVKEYVDLYDDNNEKAVEQRKSDYAKMVNH
jgi:hypothetical protein